MDHVNGSVGFLGKVVAVVLFGSMLKPEMDRVSDVDVAVEIVPKEANPERARSTNERHVLELESLGHTSVDFWTGSFSGTGRCSVTSRAGIA